MAHKGLAAVCGGMLVLVAQAASVSEQGDLLQPNSMAASTPGGSALERALIVDTNSGQRNLDLLLEARTAAEAADASEPPPAGQPPARRAAALLPQAQGQAQSSAPAAVHGTMPGTTSGTESGTVAPAATPRLLSADTPGHPGTAVQREWLGAAPGGGDVGGGGGLVDSTAQPSLPGVPMVVDNSSRSPRWTGNDATPDTDPGVRGTAIMGLALVLREYRYWLLGGLAVVGLLVAGIQAFGRRSPVRPPLRSDPAVHTTTPHRSSARHRHRHRS